MLWAVTDLASDNRSSPIRDTIQIMQRFTFQSEGRAGFVLRAGTLASRRICLVLAGFFAPVVHGLWGNTLNERVEGGFGPKFRIIEWGKMLGLMNVPEIASLRYDFRPVWLNRLVEIRRLIMYCVRRLYSHPVMYPPLIKRAIVRRYQKKYGLQVFVETGTYLGDTVAALSSRCRSVYSIELQPFFYQVARKRFQGNSRIKLAQGDSRLILPEIIDGLTEPALFWLDAHFEKGGNLRGEVACPTMQELSVILRNHSQHVILIDDAREFDGRDYPTIAEVEAHVCALRPDLHFEVGGDIIRITSH
jgi:hypothetical protein